MSDPKKQFSLKVPCETCPFRKEGGYRVYGERIEEIINSDKLFDCHKTVKYGSRDSDKRDDDAKVCAGFIIMHEKDPGLYGNQMLQVASRLGVFDIAEFRESNPAWDDVFDTREELLKAHPPRNKKEKA